jgi:hypothetical protein
MDNSEIVAVKKTEYEVNGKVRKCLLLLDPENAAEH